MTLIEVLPAIKEAGIKVKEQYLPISIIEDGYLYEDNLAVAKKDKKWVQRILEEHRTSLKKTWLLTVDAKDHVVYIPKEESK